jgi:hypothetical protein
MVWEHYLGKKVFIILNNNRKYSGICQEIVYLGKDEDKADLFMISIIDIFGKWVSFSSKEIGLIDEEDKK